MKTEEQAAVKSARVWNLLFSVVIVSGLLGCFIGLIADGYYIKAHSDPYNWMMFAYNFQDELARSRWPYGFPLFLRLASYLTGPFYIFLVNVPLLALTFLLVLKLGRLIGAGDATDSRRMAWAGMAAFIPVTVADVGGFTEYANPFRDPLSYVLLLTATIAFLQACNRRRAIGFAVSGALLGLACSVREPSVLMVVPLLIYGVIETARARGDKAFTPWRFAILFALGMGVALVPLVAQTYLTTSQAFLPPQAAIEGRLMPGLHFRWPVLVYVLRKAAAYYGESQPWLPLCALIGVVAAVFRRQRAMLGLVLPAALVFGVFYGYYHIFVPRYFYIVSLWMSLLAGYGLYAALTLLTRCIPIRVRGAAGWAVLLLCAAVAGREILDTPRSRSGFRIPQARALAREFESVLPPQAVVLAPRNMCEVVSLFAGRTSYPAPLWQEGDKPLYPALNAHVRAILDAGRPVFAMEVPWRDIPWRDAPWGDSIHLRRLFDLVPVREFSPDDYRMQVYSRDRFRLHEVRRWTRHEVSGRLPELPGLPDYRAWVAVDAGALSVADPARTWTRVTVSGIPVAESVRDGANYFALPTSIRATDRPLELALRSDGLLPAEIRLWAAPLSTPIDISFDFFHAFDHWPRWAGDILPPSPSERIPRLIGDATFEVPVPAPEAGRVVLEWRLRSNRREEGLSHRIAFHEGGAQLAEAAIPCDLNVHGAVVTLPPRPAADHRTIRISRQPNTGDVASARDGGPSPAWVDALEVYRLFVFRLGAADCVDIEVGGELDTPFIRSGFHPRPTPHPARRPFRWTDGHGTVDLPLAPSGRDMELLVEYSDRRADVPLYVPEMRFNGSPVAPESVVPDATGRNRLWRGRVPAAVAGAENTLEIVSGAWRPCDTDPESADDRTLGILIHRVRLAPHP